jgi:predicted MFS family arabinose efflux permease
VKATSAQAHDHAATFRAPPYWLAFGTFAAGIESSIMIAGLLPGMAADLEMPETAVTVTVA